MRIFSFDIGETRLASKLASKAHYSQARALIDAARYAFVQSTLRRPGDPLRPVYLYLVCTFLVEADRHRAFARLLRDLAG